MRDRAVAMHHFEFVTPPRNFMLYLTQDGDYALNTDLVAKGRAEGKDFRIVMPGGSVHLRRLKRGRARAAVIRSRICGLSYSRKTCDTLYLEALRQDGARRRWLTRLWLRAKGYALHQWRYGRKP